MDIKYPPFVNVTATLNSVNSLGTQTFVLNMTVKDKRGTITMNREEAKRLLVDLKKLVGE